MKVRLYYPRSTYLGNIGDTMADSLEDLKKTPLFQKLLADAPNIEIDFGLFNGKYASLVKRDDETVATILRCHLVVEHFLDDYLEAANPAIPNLRSVRLSFAQKLDLADNPKTYLALAMPSMKALNKVRNQLAHRLDAGDIESSLKPLYDFIAVWRKAGGYEVPVGLAAVQEFTLSICTFMHAATRTIERHGNGRGLIGMFEWYSDNPDSDHKPE